MQCCICFCTTSMVRHSCLLRPCSIGSVFFLNHAHLFLKGLGHSLQNQYVSDRRDTFSISKFFLWSCWKLFFFLILNRCLSFALLFPCFPVLFVGSSVSKAFVLRPAKNDCFWICFVSDSILCPSLGESRATPGTPAKIPLPVLAPALADTLIQDSWL